MGTPVRTCAAPTEFGSLRVGDRVRYQTERMVSEQVDTVVQVTEHSARLSKGWWITAADWFVVEETAPSTGSGPAAAAAAAAADADASAEERMVERRTGQTGPAGMGEDYWREYVTAINAAVDGGVCVREALRTVKSSTGLTHKSGQYSLWRKRLGLLPASRANDGTGVRAHAGIDRAEVVGEVNELVDQGKSIQEAWREIAPRYGIQRSSQTYHYWRRQTGCAGPKTPASVRKARNTETRAKAKGNAPAKAGITNGSANGREETRMGEKA